MSPEARALAQIIRMTGGYPAGSPMSEVHDVADAALRAGAAARPEDSLMSGSGSGSESAREDWRRRRRLHGFHVEGLPGAEEDDAGTLKMRCWRCGVTGTLGDGRDAVLALDIADWCMQHVCPGLRVT